MDKLSTLLACLPPSDFKNIFTQEIATLRAKVAELEAQLAKYQDLEPVAWRCFDGEGGYDYRSYVDNENYRNEFLKRNTNPIYKSWVEPLYTLELNNDPRS